MNRPFWSVSHLITFFFSFDNSSWIAQAKKKRSNSMPPTSKPTTPSAPVPSGIPDVFIIDEQKIQPSENREKQELYVLQWLAQVERESNRYSELYPEYWLIA